MTLENKLERLLKEVDQIVAANAQEDLFGKIPPKKDIIELFSIEEQDPEKSYELFYQNIQPFLNTFIPKDLDINKLIRELICILLTGKEKINLTYGRRGGDSRQSKTQAMEYLIDVLSEWSSTPTDYFRLAHIIHNKNIELEYCPPTRTLDEYMPNKKK